MLTEWASFLVPSLVAVIAAVMINGVAWYLRRAERAKLMAETERTGVEGADVLSAASIRMVEHWEGRVVDLEARVAAQQQQIDELKRQRHVFEVENRALCQGSRRLEAQLVSHEIRPVWRPPGVLKRAGDNG